MAIVPKMTQQVWDRITTSDIDLWTTATDNFIHCNPPTRTISTTNTNTVNGTWIPSNSTGVSTLSTRPNTTIRLDYSSAKEIAQQMRAIHKAVFKTERLLAADHYRQTQEFRIGPLLESIAFGEWTHEPLYEDDGSCSPIVIDASCAPAACTIKLNDDSKLVIEHDGSYTFHDAVNKKTHYRKKRTVVKPDGYNEFMATSGLMEKFIDFCGQHNISADEFRQLPIELFIVWLVQEAERDEGFDIEDDKLIPLMTETKRPRCVQCGKFMSRKKSEIAKVCSSICFDKATGAIAA